MQEISPQQNQWEPFEPYLSIHEHQWWQKGSKTESHGGTDYVMIREFIDAVREKRNSPASIYDGVVMSAIIPLSEHSIAQNRPLLFPDFIRRKLKINKLLFGV